MKAALEGSAEAWTHIGLMIDMGRKKEEEIGEGYNAFLKATQMGNVNSLLILKDKVKMLNSNDIEVQFNNEEMEKRN